MILIRQRLPRRNAAYFTVVDRVARETKDVVNRCCDAARAVSAALRDCCRRWYLGLTANLE